jgi:hypothetical protein
MLQPGDMLVVEGNERLFPTAPIIPKPVAPSETPRRRDGETSNAPDAPAAPRRETASEAGSRDP